MVSQVGAGAGAPRLAVVETADCGAGGALAVRSMEILPSWPPVQDEAGTAARPVVTSQEGRTLAPTLSCDCDV